MPKTTLIPYDGTLFLDSADEEQLAVFDRFVEAVGKVCDEYGYPVFIRCGGLSGKHQWKETCFVQSKEPLSTHIFRIMENVLMVMGVRLDFDGIAVRELLNLESTFTAFGGEMPVSREFRFFVIDGEYRCHHPYWPPASIYMPSVDDWLDQLMKLQTLEPLELALLKGYVEKIAKALDSGPLGYGYWSIDFCKTVSGVWYLTDLGTGNESAHWGTCQWAPEGQRDPEDPERMARIMGPTKRRERRERVHRYTKKRQIREAVHAYCDSSQSEDPSC